MKVGDVLEIHFSKHEDLPLWSNVMDANGNVQLPLIGDLQLADLSFAEAAERIHAAYVPDCYMRLDIRVVRVNKGPSN